MTTHTIRCIEQYGYRLPRCFVSKTACWRAARRLDTIVSLHIPIVPHYCDFVHYFVLPTQYQRPK